jgi:hypothetical protein
LMRNLSKSWSIASRPPLCFRVAMQTSIVCTANS